MKALSRDQRAYALENMLVVTMMGSAIGLQLMRRRHGHGEGPLLVRLIDAIPGDGMPWPLNVVNELLDHD